MSDSSTVPPGPQPVQPPPEGTSLVVLGDPPRRTCRAPIDIRAAVAEYDARCEVGRWDGPRYRMTYRLLGEGPPLVLVPGVASTYRGYGLMLNLLAARFRTVLYDYPGEAPDDGARLARTTHDDLVDDVFGLLDHLKLTTAFLFGVSFGSTVVLRALHRGPERFPGAVVQGAFARRAFTRAERAALWCGRRASGSLARLPFREAVLRYNNAQHFPNWIEDRLDYYLEQNGLTPIAAISHRLDLLGRLDLRAILPEIQNRVLLLQGNEDRVVSRRHFDELCAGLPNAQGLIMPMVGHPAHFTHPEALARTIGDWLLPSHPAGCPTSP